MSSYISVGFPYPEEAEGPSRRVLIGESCAIGGRRVPIGRWQIAGRPSSASSVAGVPLYSLSILSAHSTNATRSGGVTKRAFLPSRSASRTARAREHAVQMLSGILCPIVSRIISDRGGHPTGVTEFIVSFLIRFTASPSKNICTSCPAAARAFAWRKAKAALVDSSDPQALLIITFMICHPALPRFTKRSRWYLDARPGANEPRAAPAAGQSRHFRGRPSTRRDSLRSAVGVYAFSSRLSSFKKRQSV
jgi:hypothetical protein